MNRSKRNLLVAALLAMPLAGAWGCAGDGQDGPAGSGDPESDRRAEQRVGSDERRGGDKRTLYERLGGAPTITALVDDLTERSIADPRVNFERRDVRTNFLGAKYDPWQPTATNVQRFKQHMVEFLTLAAGGPAEYTGREIASAHKGMRITNNEFDAMVGDIKASLDKLAVGAREKKDLLAIVETTRKQIVEKP